MPHEPGTFDRGAAITRSLLGWGVVAGPFYLLVGVVLALARSGFDPTRHALSLLMLGEHGWMQRANLILTAIMVAAAAAGILRTVRSGRGLAIGAPLGAHALCLALSAVFPPDPAAGFPPGAVSEATGHGILHLVFGGLGFACLAAAAFAHSNWAARHGARRRSRTSLCCAIAILACFLGGAALAQSPLGIGLLWLCVVVGWLWLALASAHLYTVVPHPVLAERDAPGNEE